MTSYGRMLHMSKGSGMHPPNVRWKLPHRHVSVSYGQFSLNRDCIAHWLHVHFAPLLLQNPSIFFFYLAGHCWPHQFPSVWYHVCQGSIHVRVPYSKSAIFPRLYIFRVSSVKLRDLHLWSLFLMLLLCGRTEEACSMGNTLRKVHFSHPTGHYTRKKFAPPPPLEKILGAPLVILLRAVILMMLTL